MDQQQPPSSPVRGVATVTASAALATGLQNSTTLQQNLSGVPRTTSIDSHTDASSRTGSGSVGTLNTATTGAGSSNYDNSGGVPIVRGNSLGSSGGNSFTAAVSSPSPLTTPRQPQLQQQQTTVINSTASAGFAIGATHPPTPTHQHSQQPTNNNIVAAPPPWPIIPSSPCATPQRPNPTTMNNTNMTPMRSPSPGNSSINNTPLHGNTFNPTQQTTTNNPQQQSQQQLLQPPILTTADFNPQQQQQQQQQQHSLSLSMTKSGESMFSGSNTNAQLHASLQSIGSGATTTDSSVLLGLEELERQQASVERKRAEEQQRYMVEQQAQHERSVRQQVVAVQAQQQLMGAGAQGTGGSQQQIQGQSQMGRQQIIQQQGAHPQQQQPTTPRGLPPLAPTSSHSYLQNQQQQHSTEIPQQQNQQRRPTSTPISTSDVPHQIHVLEDDEDTLLSSADGSGIKKQELKRVVSIEKLRGSVSTGLRRFRSWSQDALNRQSMDQQQPNPAASSVDSTQQATLTSGEEGAATEPAGGGQQQKVDTIGGSSRHGGQQQQLRSTPIKSKKQTSTSQQKQKQHSSPINIEPYLDEDELKPLIYGYLHKLGRNGHWQKRFFETNGERLTYYKSVKRKKILATLDLCKVGEISIDWTDPEECSFTMQVKGRPYYLRAEDKARCNDWVIILNRAREARMNVGNIQLVTNNNAVVVDGEEGVVGGHRSQAGSDDYAQPCIVISALRPRTRAILNLDDTAADGLQENLNEPPDLLSSNLSAEEQIEVVKWDDNVQGQLPSPTSSQQQGVVGVVGSVTVSSGGANVGPSSPTSMAKWQKRHSKMHIISLRFLRWARSITNQADACRRERDVVVVPAHVLSAMQQSLASSSAQEVMTSTTGNDIGTHSASSGMGGAQRQGTTKHRRKPSSGLPDVMEETQQQSPSTPPENTQNRSRTSTESPSFGSTYV